MDNSEQSARISFNVVVMACGNQRVTKEITFSVPAGESLSIVGPSGCGKTTLLRAAAHLTPPHSGQVVLNDQPVTSVPHGVAMVFQNFGLFPWKTVAANIRFG